jgi:O-antigen/teichoic acid export membrane protein
MVGNYAAAVNFAVILTFIASPISLVLFPAFAKLDPQEERDLLKRVYKSSVKYTSLLIVPATMAIMVLSQPMIYLLFGDKWSYAPAFLALYVISNLFAAVGNLSIGSFLAGVGETKMSMKLGVVTLLFGIPLAFLLIPKLGIVGGILGSLFAGLPSLFAGIYWISKHYEAKIEIGSSIKILLSSAIAAAITYILLDILNSANWMRFTTGVVVFFLVYLLMTPAIGAVTPDDINDLRIMSSGLGILSAVLNVPLTIAEKVADIHQSK